MKSRETLIADNDLFSSNFDEDILIIKRKQTIFQVTDDIKKIFSFYEYLDSMLSSKKFKAVVIFDVPRKKGSIEFGRFLCKVLSSSNDSKFIDRFLNVFNRMTIVLSTVDAITVYAGQGPIPLFRLNLGLAYDYRIVANDTVFENPNIEIGMIAKGSGYFMPRLLGVKKATEVLQWKSFSAEDALHLGLVDRIVPEEKLEGETIQFVKTNIEPISTLLGVRKLLKCDQQELKRSLELEDRLIKERLGSPDFRQIFEAHCMQKYGRSVEELRESS